MFLLANIYTALDSVCFWYDGESINSTFLQDSGFALVRLEAQVIFVVLCSFDWGLRG